MNIDGFQQDNDNSHSSKKKKIDTQRVEFVPLAERWSRTVTMSA
jgi:hypothetical protein